MPMKFVNILETSKLWTCGHYLDSVSCTLLHFLTLQLYENLAPDLMQRPVLPLQRHWGLWVLPSSHLAAPSHLSRTCHFLSLHKSSKYFFLFSIKFLFWSLNSINSSTSSASLILWISLMPPRPRQSFRKCLSVSSVWLTHLAVHHFQNIIHLDTPKNSNKN